MAVYAAAEAEPSAVEATVLSGAAAAVGLIPRTLCIGVGCWWVGQVGQVWGQLAGVVQ